MYDCGDEIDKTNDDIPSSIMNGSTTVCSGSKEIWFQIRRLKKRTINNVDNGKYESYNKFIYIVGRLTEGGWS